MKRTVIVLSLIFALAIALSVSIPTIADSDSGNTVVSGTLSKHIDITAVSDAALAITLIPESPQVSEAVTVSVKSNAAWSLTVIEVDGGVDGLMNTSANAAHLTNALKVWSFVTSDYADLSGSPVTIKNDGTKTTGGSAYTTPNITFQQEAEYDDTPGDYSINVQFTASN